MLKGNLSTRPFYNDRLVTAAIATAGLLVLLLTIFNVTRLVTLSRERAEVGARITADRDEAARIRADIDRMQAGVDRATLTQLASSARQANHIIDQRTFSWTTLLGLLERTLPPDVRLTSISPRLDGGVFRVSMAVVARDLDDVDVFIETLSATGRFYDVAPTEQRAADDGTFQAIVQAAYLPPARPNAPRGQAVAPGAP